MTNQICVGAKVEWTTTRPGHEGEIVQGVVLYVPTRIPGNIDVMSEHGQHSVLRTMLRVLA